jgi:hypothetical protein
MNDLVQTTPGNWQAVVVFDGYASRPLEIRLFLPPDYEPDADVFHNLLINLSHTGRPYALESFGTAEAVTMQLVCDPRDARLVAGQIRSHVPELVVVPVSDSLIRAGASAGSSHLEITDLNSSQTSFDPLPTPRVDPCIGLIGALAHLKSGEFGLCQVLFQPVSNAFIQALERVLPHPAEVDDILGITSDREWALLNGYRYHGPKTPQLVRRAEMLALISKLNAKLEHPLFTP